MNLEPFKGESSSWFVWLDLHRCGLAFARWRPFAFTGSARNTLGLARGASPIRQRRVSAELFSPSRLITGV